MIKELTKLPALSTIVKNRNEYSKDDLDHLKGLAIKEKERLEKSKLKIDEKLKLVAETEEFIHFCEIRWVDTETLEVTGESGVTDYAAEAGIITDGEYDSEEVVNAADERTM